ncbi:DUF2971 domain-containing protein, partial [Bacillus cereus]|nr:DUF2971 domain-containing protein [Bacillus cereus]
LRRYVPIGIAFPKHFFYQKGGRPVLYENKEIAKKILPQEEWWRIVNFDLDDEENIIDWTHEREWRTKGDFEFDLKEATILLVNHNAYESFMNSTKEDILKQLGGVVVLRSVLY